ncbi:MAG: response regulator [Selenomonadaceae bacterium]
MSQNNVLFVDDEPSVLSAIRRAVTDENYQSFFAESAADALALMDKDSFSVIVTDMRMPGMDGLALLKIVKAQYPKTIRVVLSGYTQLSQLLVTINQGEIFKFITKPWTSEDELLPVVAQAVDYYNLQQERDILNDTLIAKNITYQNMLRTMKDKKLQEQADFHNLYKISTLLFSLWKNHIISFSKTTATNRPLLENEIVDISALIYLTYLKQLPSAIATKPISNVIENILASSDGRIIFTTTAEDNFTITGNHDFFIMIFKILFHILPAEEDQISCTLSKNTDTTASKGLSFLIELTCAALTTHNKNQLKIACALLKKMGTLYSIGIFFGTEQPHSCYVKIDWIYD